MLFDPQTAQARINEPEVENHQSIARMQENFRAFVEGSDDAINGKTIDGLG